MPKLWNATVDAHRREVGDAILDAVASLVTKHGLLSVTMSQIAHETGIGRATLYKYFPDVQAMVIAWHERRIAEHLQQLAAIRDGGGAPADRLSAILEAYAFIQHEHRRSGLSALVHQGEHVAHAQQHLKGMLRDLIAECATTGAARHDVPAAELAGYCLHALNAAEGLASRDAVRRLVEVTKSGLGISASGRRAK